MRRMHAPALAVLTAVVLLLAPAAPARAEDSPMRAVFKSTLFGGLVGLALGGAVELVSDGADGDAWKWGLAGGTFFGFGYGLWHETRKAGSQGFLRGDADGWRLGAPVPGLRVGGATGWEVRAPIASLRF